MVALFGLADEIVTREQVSQWLKKDSDNDFVKCSDTQLAIFLNGFINDNRGKKAGPQIAPEKRLSNNIILTKLKIALNLQADGIIDLLNTVDFRLSKPELSAFSRKADHKNYRECKDQVIRNLLHAIDKKYHVTRTNKYTEPVSDEVKPKSNSTNYAKKKVKPNEPFVEGARPNASAIYQNPKTKKDNAAKTDRKVLKLK
jgi:uncharacterized protein YehS (DUF1456 family)